jgi:hypothetical protein
MLDGARILYLLKSNPYVLGVQRHVMDLACAFSGRFAETTIASNPVPFADELRAAAGAWVALTAT